MIGGLPTGAAYGAAIKYTSEGDYSFLDPTPDSQVRSRITYDQIADAARTGYSVYQSVRSRTGSPPTPAPPIVQRGVAPSWLGGDLSRYLPADYRAGRANGGAASGAGLAPDPVWIAAGIGALVLVYLALRK